MAAAVRQTFEEFKAKLEASLTDKNKFTEILEKVEGKTGIKRLHIVMGMVAVMGLYLMVGYGADFLCNLIGFIYPAYASIKAVESMQKDDDTKWLTYWVVYSLFALCEFFADIMFCWLPFYSFFKCVFLIYCMAPVKSNGAIAIYYKIIRPFILRYESKIDSGAVKIKDATKKLFNEAEEIARDTATDVYKRNVAADSSKLE